MFMGLTDLMSEIKQDPGNFIGDESMENKVLQHVLQLVEDKISEVKNQAVKWYAYCGIGSRNVILTRIEVLVHSSRLFAKVKWNLLFPDLSTSLVAKTRKSEISLGLVRRY